MAIGTITNFPGPYQLRIFYTITSGSVPIQHKLQLNCNLQTDPPGGTPFSAINVVSSTGGFSPLQTEVDAIVALLQPLYNIAATQFDYAELWKYEPNSFNAQFVSTYTIGLAGTSGTGNSAAAESIFTFRTTEGGVMKVHLMESTKTLGNPQGYGALDAPHAAVADYFKNTPAAAFFIGRDTSYPFAFRFLFPGQNEHLFKRRYGRAA